VKRLADKSQVLFIGDSITEGWRTSGQAIWEGE
jgi:lysophospholipase L1-like esterase